VVFIHTSKTRPETSSIHSQYTGLLILVVLITPSIRTLNYLITGALRNTSKPNKSKSSESFRHGLLRPDLILAYRRNANLPRHLQKYLSRGLVCARLFIQQLRKRWLLRRPNHSRSYFLVVQSVPCRPNPRLETRRQNILQRIRLRCQRVVNASLYALRRHWRSKQSLCNHRPHQNLYITMPLTPLSIPPLLIIRPKRSPLLRRSHHNTSTTETRPASSSPQSKRILRKNPSIRQNRPPAASTAHPSRTQVPRGVKYGARAITPRRAYAAAKPEGGRYRRCQTE